VNFVMVAAAVLWGIALLIPVGLVLDGDTLVVVGAIAVVLSAPLDLVLWMRQRR
jgi:hypothetical protein